MSTIPNLLTWSVIDVETGSTSEHYDSLAMHSHKKSRIADHLNRIRKDEM